MLGVPLSAQMRRALTVIGKSTAFLDREIVLGRPSNRIFVLEGQSVIGFGVI